MTVFVHGTASGYTYRGCRCEPCRDAAVLARKRYRLRALERGGPLTTDPTGTVRRVQALVALGWPVRLIAEEANVNEKSLRTFMYSPGDTVTVTRAEAIAVVFERLCMTRGPSKASATIARKRGYVPPLAWDDIDDPNEVPEGVAA